MKRFKSLSIVMAMAIAVVVGLPSVVHAGKSAGTVKNNVQVLMEYKDGSTLPIPEAQVGVAGGVLNTKFLLGSEYHTCDDSGKVEFKQTSRITDMYFKLPQAWADNVESPKAEYRAKLMGTFKYHNYKVESKKIKDNRFRVGMPLAWTTVDMKISFNAKSFDVTFKNGSGQDTVSVEYLKKVEKPEAPVKEGHTFLGWYQGDNKFDFDKTPITKNIELTAKWEKNKYTVSFDSAGGTEVESKTVVYGEKVKEPNIPVKEGHTFLGWYQGEDKFDFNKGIKGNISLTAKWEKNKYTVSFDSAGGTAVESKTVVYGEKVEQPNIPVKEGHTFLGWYQGENKFDFDKTPITKNIELTAKWEKNKYTVSFNSDNGTTAVTQTVEYGEKVQQPSEPIKDGYKFLGWYQGENKFDFNTEIKGNISLTAKWEMIPQTPKLVINLKAYGTGMFDRFHLLATDANGEPLDLTDIVKAVSVDGKTYSSVTSIHQAWYENKYYIDGNKMHMKRLENGQTLTITDKDGTDHSYSYSNGTLTLLP